MIILPLGVQSDRFQQAFPATGLNPKSSLDFNSITGTYLLKPTKPILKFILLKIKNNTKFKTNNFLKKK